MEPAFRALDTIVVRLSLLADDHVTPRLPCDLDASEALCAFLREAAADLVVREAIEVSSPSLGATLDKVVSGAPVQSAQLRRAVLAVTRYLSRMTSRSTPFGLMAGVAAGRFGDDPKVRIGTSHRKHVRPDMGWLDDIVRRWEIETPVLERLRVVANDLSFVRGDRLVLPLVRVDTDERAPDDREQTVRHTRAVRATMAAARVPVPYSELISRLSAKFLGVPEETIRQMVAQLVELQFLLTDLRPSATLADPVRHVLDRLSDAPRPSDSGPPADGQGTVLLRAVEDALARYAAAPVGAGYEEWRAATGTMRRLHASDQLIHVDLGMDADLVLPQEVAAELEAAATVVWRLAPPDRAPTDPLARYRAEFIERYGFHNPVPVKEVLNPHLGIGPPAGYLLPPGTRASAVQTTDAKERDSLLLGLVQRPVGDEIILDNELVERLARPDNSETPTSYLEACVQVLAHSENALRAGDFRLVFSPLNFTVPGAMYGRFLPLLPEEFRTAVADLGDVGTADDTAPRVQLVGSTVPGRTQNIAQVPFLTQETVRVGVFAERPAALSLDDLMIGADHERFYVMSARDGREVMPLTYHALNPTLTMPNPVRLLMEIGLGGTPPWRPWNWGACERMPYLPRVRFGRTVLSSARWIPDPQLTEERDWRRWRRAFEHWRRQQAVPDTVYAISADHRIRLDLTSEVYLRILYADLRKRPGMVLQEDLAVAGTGYGNGWSRGHAAEIVVPLRPVRRPRIRTAPPAMNPAVLTVTQRPAYPPGGEWLYVKVYAAPGRHDELLTRHLPDLVDQAASITDRWFFVRYRDDEAHLRIRFHGASASLNTHLLPAVHRWAADLTAAGLIRNIMLDTYRPEVARYGGPEAIESAERAFHADARSVLEQLALRDRGIIGLPMELLLAANHLDLMAGLDPDGWRNRLLTLYPKGAHHTAFQRCRRETVRVLHPTAGLVEPFTFPGGADLIKSWRQRAPAVRTYGRLIRDSAVDASAVFASVLHMHHIRLAGINPRVEQDAYAIARGVVQADEDRKRQIRRERR